MALLLLSANLWIYLNYIGPREKAAAHGQTSSQPTQGDLYSPWRGTQELLLHDRDPYSPGVTRDLQLGYYGRVLADSADEEQDQQRFAYPVYVSFFLAPFVRMEFSTVRLTFFWLLIASTFASVALWMRLVRMNISISLLVVAALVISSVPAVQGLNFQQLGLLVAGLLAASGALLVRGHFLPAGMLLALATIKPQMSIFLILWLMFWAIADWRRRKPLVIGFAFTLSLLVVLGEALSPGWILNFVAGLPAYERYTGGGNFLITALPKSLAVAASALAGAVIAITVWRSRRVEQTSPAFVFTFVMVLVFTVLVAPAMTATFNQILLLPALLFAGQSLSKSKGISRTVLFALAFVVISPWALGAVAVTLWAVHSSVLHSFWMAPLWASVLLPFVAFVALCLQFKEIPGLGRSEPVKF